MKPVYALVLAAASAPLCVQASPATSVGSSHLDIYYSNLDFEVSDDTGSASIDGNGGGLGFWIGNGVGLFTAEIQKDSLDGNESGFSFDADVRTLRAGLGYRFLTQRNAQSWIRAEYVGFDSDINVAGVGSGADEQNGYGVHVGALLGGGPVRGYGEIGIVDVDDLDGIEYKLGLNLQPGMVGGFIEYRVTDLELDNFDLDEKFSNLRVGLRVAF